MLFQDKLHYSELWGVIFSMAFCSFHDSAIIDSAASVRRAADPEWRLAKDRGVSQQTKPALINAPFFFGGCFGCFWCFFFLSRLFFPFTQFPFSGFHFFLLQAYHCESLSLQSQAVLGPELERESSRERECERESVLTYPHTQHTLLKG